MLFILKIVLACSSPAPAPEPVSIPVKADVVPVEPALSPSGITPGVEAPELARQLTTIWDVILDSNHDGAILDSYGHLHQRVFRILSEDDALLASVLDLLADDVAAHTLANVTAQKQARGTVRKARSTVPAWRIVDPSPAEVLMALYREAEADSGTPWHLLAAVHLIETRMGRLQGVSVAGAQGPMQFMPQTWAAYGNGDVTDERDAILAAGRYLAAMGVAEDVDAALWAYNHSHRYVDSVRTWSNQMRARPLLFRAYHGWEVYYLTTRGAVWLAPGYEEDVPVPVNDWCVSSRACPD